MPDEGKSLAIGVLRESFPDERRVALIPASIPALIKRGLNVLIESGAGIRAGFEDAEFAESGAKIESDRGAILASADILLQVRAAGANPLAGRSDVDAMHEGQILIACCEPLSEPSAMSDLAGRDVTTFALELLPRITRAQSMDVLSSMATIAGYKAVLLAADALPRMFPMLMTAAGTVAAARVFVIGAGVAGLQAIATARRLGAIVQGYDLRPAVREEVESLGAKFVELPLPTSEDDGSGGYAQAMDDDFYRRQRELMHSVVTRMRRRDHDCCCAGQTGADVGDRRHGAVDGGGQRDCGSGGGTGWELRIDPTGRNRGDTRRDHPGAAEHSQYNSFSRQPDVCQKHHDLFDANDRSRRAVGDQLGR